MKHIYTYIFGLHLLLGIHSGYAQETVFTGLQSNLKKGQKYFEQGAYQDALEYLLVAQKRKRTPNEVYMQIAQSYARLNNHKDAVYWFQQYKRESGELPLGMDYLHAESLSSLGRYDEAIVCYQRHGDRNPNDRRVLQKIWRLKNLKYLYEDSVYYAVKPVPFNSDAMEYGPYMLADQLIFVSNRESFGGIKVLDGVNKKPFFKRYAVEIERESSLQVNDYGKVKPFATEIDGLRHQGPISFSADGSLAVFTQTSRDKSPDGNYLPQLFYATKNSGIWKTPIPFEFNNASYITSNPSLNSEGTILYFSANFPDGFGGKDLYKSEKTNHSWGAPENLGSKVNTAGDEDFPFIHSNGALYFSSNGHGGLGGLDVFMINLKDPGNSEVKNLGYPVNTQFDDFSLVLNESSTHGYIASNRTEGIMNDDIFELEIDLQTYPLTISGILKYRNAQWEDELTIDLLVEGRLQLIDAYNRQVVYETISDENGAFSLEVPYSSQFKIKVIHAQLGVHTVSLEIHKNKKLHNHHEIVIVKEQFQN